LIEKFLPIGIQDFEQIRTGNFVYVDKTRHIYEMVRPSQGFYFMSRPRRFGKSLTVSLMKCLFQGKKALFDGLWISEQADWEWKAHPVVTVDFNELYHDTPENLEQSLQTNLLKTAAEYGVEIRDTLLPGQFGELIISLYQKTKRPVVVLVDEYDKPIISHLGKGKEALEIAKKNRDIMKYFFGVLKGINVSPCLRFVFLTGVSKFSRVSIFSELNNLNDITMNRKYADMMGYTHPELEAHFAEHLTEFAEETERKPDEIKEKLKAYYDGYRFSEGETRVYNPFSVLNSLGEKAFKNYWFETGTPTFLVDVLKERQWYPPNIEKMRATPVMFSVYEIERLQPEALLFQTGYVTIKEVDEDLYTFGYPNREVKSAFLEVLFHAYTEGLNDSARFSLLSRHLRSENLAAFMETITAIYASIPYTLEAKRDEAYFHTLFYLMVSASGIHARSEVLTSDGRIDLVMEFADKVYILEFKCNQSADAAIAQIRDKQYARPFIQTQKKIILMGIDFSMENRNISEWKHEYLKGAA
jgi:hypothetical protein